MLIPHTDLILKLIPQILFLCMVSSSSAGNLDNLALRVAYMFSCRMKMRVRLGKYILFRHSSLFSSKAGLHWALHLKGVQIKNLK